MRIPQVFTLIPIQAHRAVDSALTTARFQAILQMPSAAF